MSNHGGIQMKILHKKTPKTLTSGKKKYQIKVQGQLIPVSEEVYLSYYRMSRRERHLQEKDITHGVCYYSALDNEEINGEEAIPDLVSPRVDDMVMDKLMVEKLHHCLTRLSKADRELIFALYFQCKTQVELEKETGVKQQTISYRERQIRIKLKKMMEK
jgi:RNA polymerase sigma factor (sigma-70 family)